MSANSLINIDTAKPETQSATFVRLWQIESRGDNSGPPDIKPKDFKKKIDWNSQKECNQLTFEHNGHMYYAAYSLPVHYVEGRDRFKMVDLFVVSQDPIKTQGKFDECVRVAREAQGLSQKLIEKLLPELLTIPYIAVIAGRGDKFDPRRVPAAMKRNDIDIMLFSTLPFDSPRREEIISKIIEISQKYKGLNFSYEFITPRLAGSEVAVTDHLENQLGISFDILPFPEILQMTDAYIAGMSGYDVDALQYGQTLADRSGGEFQLIKARTLRLNGR